MWQVPLTEEQQEAQEAKPERMALGGGGGFQVGAPKHRIEEERAIVVLPEMWSLPLPNTSLPEQVSASVAGILVYPLSLLEEISLEQHLLPRHTVQHVYSICMMDFRCNLCLWDPCSCLTQPCLSKSLPYCGILVYPPCATPPPLPPGGKRAWHCQKSLPLCAIG